MFMQVECNGVNAIPGTLFAPAGQIFKNYPTFVDDVLHLYAGNEELYNVIMGSTL